MRWRLRREEGAVHEVEAEEGGGGSA
jgi:hypothetical protein